GKGAGTDAKGTTGKDPKTPKDSKGRKWLKDRGPQPDSPKPWVGRGDKPKKNRKKKGSDDASSTTARDGLDPKDPKGPKGGVGDDVPPKPDYDPDEYVDAELVDDDLPPKPDVDPDDVIDGEVIDEDRIALVKAKREKERRRQAIAAGKQAEKDAARDGTMGDPLKVKLERIREENQRIDLELHREDQLIALAAGTEKRRSNPVSYPVATTQPTGTSTAGVAVA
uniref:hypothetical protein n=1 Tax=Streptomyces capuensis TaxID=1464056 RepID=UPI000518B9EF